METFPALKKSLIAKSKFCSDEVNSIKNLGLNLLVVNEPSPSINPNNQCQVILKSKFKGKERFYLPVFINVLIFKI